VRAAMWHTHAPAGKTPIRYPKFGVFKKSQRHS
jgi:hypothetical protein